MIAKKQVGIAATAALACLLFVYYSRSTGESFRARLDSVREVENIRRREWEKITLRSAAEPNTSRPPDSIVIGVRKCGTGAFRDFIRLHPLIKMKYGEAHYYDLNLEKGLDYYISQLPNGTKYDVVMEKTPAYFVSMPPDLPSIIHQNSPYVKLILILCEPSARAFSDYVMRQRKGSLTTKGRQFKQYVDHYLARFKKLFHNASMRDNKFEVGKIYEQLEHTGMLTFGGGIYAYFLRRWMDEFPPEQLLVLDGEEFINNPGTVMEQVQDYLGVPKLLRDEDFVKNPTTGMYCVRPWWNASYDFKAELAVTSSWQENLICAGKGKGATRALTAGQTLGSAQEKQLREYYRPYNEILYKIIGHRFNW